MEYKGIHSHVSSSQELLKRSEKKRIRASKTLEQMKREVRQHGMVRTCLVLPPPWNSRPKSKVVNNLTSSPTAGQYTKVPTKPTNHSKFTGKCRTPRCVE
ncbi:B3 DNA binding domain-containing protein [Cinnamomum micranthum f. kanehirae]|uniref:B3 DNA binding domain-containing protein n=1 Tax=Cinnamomum micranthum f. kanehirae TaxID=337451 RepID=A0A443Q1T8_9MAGN|nr:B3 DNA binding domain-containing protein [Cinnamomum micranthum f. kanehirae]